VNGRGLAPPPSVLKVLHVAERTSGHAVESAAILTADAALAGQLLPRWADSSALPLVQTTEAGSRGGCRPRQGEQEGAEGEEQEDPSPGSGAHETRFGGWCLHGSHRVISFSVASSGPAWIAVPA